ncbi:MAG: NADH-quinone oxidoreductase subunit NuoH [Candidatus Schekmanbacteria bacterium]|nr:MAG: NADH-quinone oxidoreductase subunit NuoH [Candidatus Schekmanbacteria bacterium]
MGGTNISSLLTNTLFIKVVEILFIFSATMGTVAYLTWVERRVSAFMQKRLGPNRVGFAGLLQPLADGLKFIMKEDIIPLHVNKFFYVLAPMISIIPALITFAVIPFGAPTTFNGLLDKPIELQITELNVGILYIIAVASLGVYGIVLGGWASNNKYSLMGGLRSSAQMISYELAMGLALVGVIMTAGSLNLSDIVIKQGKYWFIFPQILGFVVFIISSFAETNRLPFDLPEAESELVAGYHTEYSSMKFAMFFMAEYANMITASALIVTLYFGGWQGLPIGGWLNLPIIDKLWFMPLIWFAIKVGVVLFFFVWVRWTFPRFRYDQLMAFGWKVLVPIALLNILITGTLIYWNII